MVSVAQSNNSRHKLTTTSNRTIAGRVKSLVVAVNLTSPQLSYLHSNIPVQSDLGSKTVTKNKKAIMVNRTTIRKRKTMVRSSPILFRRHKVRHVVPNTRKDLSTPTLANSRSHPRVIASSERSRFKPVGHTGVPTRCAPQMILMMARRSNLRLSTNRIESIAERSTNISNSSIKIIDSLKAMSASLGLQSMPPIFHGKTLRHSYLANAT